jgi:hypothetical protein
VEEGVFRERVFGGTLGVEIGLEESGKVLWGVRLGLRGKKKNARMGEAFPVGIAVVRFGR